nr:hypothetical protein [Bacteroidia bacterium]
MGVLTSGFSSIGGSNDYSLACYNNDGTVDSSFGINGFVTTALSSGEDKPYAMSIQSDDKIILAGTSDWDFALARYLSELNVGIIEDNN